MTFQKARKEVTRPGEGVTPYMDYIGIHEYGFLAILVINNYGFCTLVLSWLCLLEESFFIIIRDNN